MTFKWQIYLEKKFVRLVGAENIHTSLYSIPSIYGGKVSHVRDNINILPISLLLSELSILKLKKLELRYMKVGAASIRLLDQIEHIACDNYNFYAKVGADTLQIKFLIKYTAKTNIASSLPNLPLLVLFLSESHFFFFMNSSAFFNLIRILV